MPPDATNSPSHTHSLKGVLHANGFNAPRLARVSLPEWCCKRCVWITTWGVCVCIERETTAGAIILFQSPLGVSFCWRQRGQSVYRTLMFAIINNSHWLLHSLSLLAHPFTHLFLICFNHLLLTDIIARVHWHSVLSQLLANSHCWLYLLQTMMRLIINAVMLMFCLLVKNNVDDTQTHTQTVK